MGQEVIFLFFSHCFDSYEEALKHLTMAKRDKILVCYEDLEKDVVTIFLFHCYRNFGKIFPVLLTLRNASHGGRKTINGQCHNFTFKVLFSPASCCGM